MNAIKAFFNDEAKRAYIYRVLIAIGGLLVGFGVISGDQQAMILGVVVAVLNIMPTANTTTKSSATIKSESSSN